MTVKEKDEDVVILQLESATNPEMWCLMKLLHGGPQTRKYCQILMFLKMCYNPLKQIGRAHV